MCPQYLAMENNRCISFKHVRPDSMGQLIRSRMSNQTFQFSSDYNWRPLPGHTANTASCKCAMLVISDLTTIQVMDLTRNRIWQEDKKQKGNEDQEHTTLSKHLDSSWHPTNRWGPNFNKLISQSVVVDCLTDTFWWERVIHKVKLYNYKGTSRKSHYQ